MSFGENLQTIRKKNQLSQEGLAEMLGVSRQAVSKWELGEGYPEVEKLMLLSKKLNISLDSLLGGENTTADPGEGKAPAGIRIVSPHEGPVPSSSRAAKTAPNLRCTHPRGKTCPCGERRTPSLPGTEIWKT